MVQFKAHDAEKKQRVVAAATRQNYKRVTIGVFVFYCAIRFVLLFSSVDIWSFVALAFFSAVTYLCVSSIIAGAEQGSDYSMAQDVLFVTWFVQLGTLASSWFWLAMLVIPGYLLYQYGPMLMQFCRSQQGEEGEQEDNSKKKPKVKYRSIRR